MRGTRHRSRPPRPRLHGGHPHLDPGVRYGRILWSPDPTTSAFRNDRPAPTTVAPSQDPRPIFMARFLNAPNGPPAK